MSDTLARNDEDERTALRHKRLAEKQARIDADLRISSVAAQVIAEHPELDLDAPNPQSPGAHWVYLEPFDLLGADPEVRRDAALDWLRRHARAVQFVARELGHTHPIGKSADPDHFGVAFYLPIDGTEFGVIGVSAEVPARLTCEMVPTGEVTTIPAQPERTEPVMERRCPPSIFAGIDDEAVA